MRVNCVRVKFRDPIRDHTWAGLQRIVGDCASGTIGGVPRRGDLDSNVMEALIDERSGSVLDLLKVVSCGVDIHGGGIPGFASEQVIHRHIS